MAGIGFELKKMFDKKTVLSQIKAYGYAGIVCVGPMILGMALLLGIRLISGLGGATLREQELINVMVTYALLFSMVFTNTLSMVVTRFTADQLYLEEQDMIMPSFWGSTSLLLAAGGIFYGIFLCFSGIPFLYAVLSLLLFEELICVWNEMNYLTAIKDYQGILISFAAAIAVAFGFAGLFILLKLSMVPAMLLSVTLGYGVLVLLYYYLLSRYFPEGKTSAACFLEWVDKYPKLILLGLFLSFGLFGHLVIMWTGACRVQIQGLFYGAPMYDIPALLAFLSILVTTVNFVTSVEVNFYPKYRNFFSLFNDGGSLMDIRQAEKEMKSTLYRELTNTFMRQFFVTVVFVIAGSIFWQKLPLGITDDMLGIYRVLCIGYAFYAIGNCVMLIQLYFADNTGALASVTAFMAVSCVITYLFRFSGAKWYGIGFLIGGVAYTAVSMILLKVYLHRLLYRVLCSQPIILAEKRGFFTKIAMRCQKAYRRKYRDFRELERESEEEKSAE